MNFKAKFLVILIFSFFGSTFFIFSQTKVTDLVFVYEDKEVFPGYLGNSDKIDYSKPGMAVDGFLMLEKILPVKISFKRMPWKRCLESELKNGTVDGAFLASYKKEREVFGRYPTTKDGKIDESRRWETSVYVFYKLSGSKVSWDGNKIFNLVNPIGAPQGYSIIGDIEKMGYKVDTSEKTFSDFQKLINKRIDLAAELESQGDYVLENNPKISQEIEKIPVPIASKPYYLMLSHQFYEKNPKLAEKIWDAVRDIREKEYKNLMKKYF